MNMNDEYKMLREELMFNSKQIYLYFAFIVTAVSTMLAYVFTNIDKPNSNSIFIAIFVLLICAAARVKRLLSTNTSISTYMEVFLEPYIDGRNWETLCHYQVNRCNSQELDKRNPLINIMVFKSMSVWFLLSIITYIIVLFENNKVNICNIVKSSPVNSAFNTLMFLILMYITLSSKIDRDKYIKHWKKVKEMEKRV